MRRAPDFVVKNQNRGFTLIEVIVALTIIAVALAAIISAASATVRNAAGLQERTFAHWVAMNKLAELQIMKQWPAPHKTDGSTLMAEHEWFWTMDVTDTDVKTMRKVEIAVRANENDENSLVNLTGFVAK